MVAVGAVYSAGSPGIVDRKRRQYYFAMVGDSFDTIIIRFRDPRVCIIRPSPGKMSAASIRIVTATDHLSGLGLALPPRLFIA